MSPENTIFMMPDRKRFNYMRLMLLSEGKILDLPWQSHLVGCLTFPVSLFGRSRWRGGRFAWSMIRDVF
jgi:hypothetical protein